MRWQRWGVTGGPCRGMEEGGEDGGREEARGAPMLLRQYPSADWTQSNSLKVSASAARLPSLQGGGSALLCWISDSLNARQAVD